MHILAIAIPLALDLCMLHRVIHSIATGYVAIVSLTIYSSYSIKHKQTRCILKFEKGSIGIAAKVFKQVTNLNQLLIRNSYISMNHPVLATYNSKPYSYINKAFSTISTKYNLYFGCIYILYQPE